MNDGPHIVAVSGDPGGAEALAPVLLALQATDTKLRLFAYHQAQAMWRARGLDFASLPTETTEADAVSLLQSSEADLLLVSTSMNGVNLERKFTAAARTLGLPSLGVLDLWTNYRARFLDDRGEMALVPDRLAIMDERARQEMMAEGFEPERLVVAGQPAFEEVVRWRTEAPEDLHRKIRLSLKVDESEWLVVFGSQPLSRLAEQDGAASLGYTEQTVLPMLIEALEKIATRSGRAITLLIRPHPRESEADYAPFRSPAISILVSMAGHRREIALAADVVVGMNSAFLIEACYLGCATLSLQPGLRLPDSLPTNLAGWSRAVYRAEHVEPALGELLLEPASCPTVRRCRHELRSPLDATGNILALIAGMLQDVPSKLARH